jgi:PqqD family protein of HPr-rel-A system
MPQIWRALGGPELSLRRWDNDYVVYSELTGQTHLLASFPALVLTLLKEGSSNPPELSARIAEALQLEEDEKLLTTVEQTLADFERLGLVEQNAV